MNEGQVICMFYIQRHQLLYSCFSTLKKMKENKRKHINPP